VYPVVKEDEGPIPAEKEGDESVVEDRDSLQEHRSALQLQAALMETEGVEEGFSRCKQMHHCLPLDL